MQEKYKVSEKESRKSSFKPEIPRDHEAANLGLLRHGQSSSARARPPSMITRKVKDWKKPDIEHWAKENKIMYVTTFTLCLKLLISTVYRSAIYWSTV